MARTKKIELYSLLIVRDGQVEMEQNLDAESVKVKLVAVELDGLKAYVFAGPQVYWRTEIALYADDAPTSQPANTPKRKYTKRKPAEVKVEPPKGANGATGEKKASEEQRQ